MKKILKLIPIFIVSLAFMIPSFPNTSEAASYGPWKNVRGISGCKVRVVTDYSVYTTSATTIDAYAQSTGCPKFYYEMRVVNPGLHAGGTIQTGNFSFQTPWKYFNINSNSVPTSSGLNYVYVSVSLYSQPSMTGHNYVDVVDGRQLSVYR